jgi:two-component system LytT family response regulator
MEKIKAIIVDDVRLDIELLREVLRTECPAVDIIGEAQTIKEAESLIREKKPQLVFLDISLDNDGVTSFSLLEKIGEKNILFEIIFYTAHGNRDNKSKAINFSDLEFIHKPVDPEAVSLAVQKVLKRMGGETYRKQIEVLLEIIRQADKSNTPIVLERVGGQKAFVRVGNIVMLKADGQMTEITLQSGEMFRAVKHLGHYENLLNDHYFYRIHHNLILNLLYADRVNNQDRTIVLSTGQIVTASKQKFSDFSQFIRDNRQQLPQLSSAGIMNMLRRIIGTYRGD